MAPREKRIDPATVPEISRRMRLLRITTGLSQYDFSEQLGVARNVWSNVEGEFGRIGVDTAMKLCRKYLVTLDWVYFGDERMVPHGLVEQLRAAEPIEREEAAKRAAKKKGNPSNKKKA